MMDFDFMSGIGWRDAVLGVAALIGVYLVISVIRLFQVAGKGRDGEEQGGKLSGWKSHSAVEVPRPEPTPAVPGPKFAEELARSNVEVELERLRRESANQREELARLAEELSRLKATRNVSPLYDEAMTLAQQGMPAVGIAGHCGISIGEAELVAALARGGSEFERHEQGEVRDERNTNY